HEALPIGGEASLVTLEAIVKLPCCRFPETYFLSVRNQPLAVRRPAEPCPAGLRELSHLSTAFHVPNHKSSSLLPGAQLRAVRCPDELIADVATPSDQDSEEFPSLRVPQTDRPIIAYGGQLLAVWTVGQSPYRAAMPFGCQFPTCNSFAG